MATVVSAVLAACLAPMTAELTAAEAADVRRCVYFGELKVEFGPGGPGPAFTPRLLVPPRLADIHRRRPVAVLALLARIIDGGRPRDSALAGGYVVALTSSPVVAGRLLEHFDEETYDEIGEGQRVTPRERWLIAARRRLGGS